jgi:hypothetical protein
MKAGKNCVFWALGLLGVAGGLALFGWWGIGWAINKVYTVQLTDVSSDDELELIAAA